MVTNHITYDRPSLDVEYDYVGIIDALDPTDRKDFGITEELRTLLKEAGVTTALAEVASSPELLGALETFRKEAVAGKRFMLHFVAHGDENGIGIGTELAGWSQIRPFLQRIHAATEGTLQLNMSTCKGLYGARIVGGAEPYPFFGLIGASENLSVGDALDANRVVYTKWLAGMSIPQLVAAANSVIGREVLYPISAEGYQKLSAGPMGGSRSGEM